MRSADDGARSRRVLGAVVVAALLVAAPVVARLVEDLPTTPSASASPSGPTSAAGAPTSPTGAGTTSATGTAAPTDPGASSTAPTTSTVSATGATGLPTALPTSGPGIDEPGVLLVVQVRADEALDVQEIVRLADPVDSVSLTPPDLSGAGDGFAGSRPVASQVQLSSQGQPAVVPGGAVQARVRIPLGAERTTYELSYRLEGSTVRSVPSISQRALAAVRPLSSDLGELPVVVLAPGPAVLNLSCPLLPAQRRTCAAGSAGSMGTADPLPAPDALVVLQVDLPRI